VVGDWYGNDWFISEGLKAGEKVVTDGVLTLRPGAPVVVKPAAAAAVPAASGGVSEAAPLKAESGHDKP
jgi:membrane fusion protein (multidrug efflux system)